MSVLNIQPGQTSMSIVGRCMRGFGFIRLDPTNLGVTKDHTRREGEELWMTGERTTKVAVHFLDASYILSPSISGQGSKINPGADGVCVRTRLTGNIPRGAIPETLRG